MDKEERMIGQLKDWAVRLSESPVPKDMLEAYIIRKDIVTRELTDKERQMLHIHNGTAHMFKDKTTCYHCDTDIDADMMCEDCSKELLGDCDECGKRIRNKVYSSCGVSETTGVPYNLCHTCSRLYTQCVYFHKYNRCDIAVKVDKICTTCHVQYCNGHMDAHLHEDMNRFQREYHRTIYEGAEGVKIKDKRLVGIELEAIGGDYEKLYIGLDRSTGISHDGSLKGNNPVEIQTSPASTDILEALVVNGCSSLSNAGFKINDTCGLHIHVDCNDISNKPTKVRQLINTYYAIEPIIYMMLPTSRTDNAYAQPLSNWISSIGLRSLAEAGRITMHRLEEEWYKSASTREITRCKERKYDSSRYHGLNLHPLFQEGHIEMRYHHGTLDPNVVKNWIKFHLHIVNWAVKHYKEIDIESVYNERHSTQKVNRMLKCLRFPTDLRRYVRRSIRRSNRINKITKVPCVG